VRAPLAAGVRSAQQMRNLPRQPVFTSAEAAATGLTRSGLRHALGRGDIMRLRRDCYAAAQPLTPDLLGHAAARRHPDAVIADRCALLVHGLPLVGAAPRVAELTVPPRANANVVAAHVYRASLRECDVTVVDGSRVTSVARTLVDVARHRPTGTAVAAIDAALYRGLVTPDELDDVLLSCWNWPLIRRAQRAVRLADGRAESPLESVSRLVFSWLRLPAPRLQQAIFDRHGRLLARTDFYWDEFGVFGEAEGRSKYDAREVLTLEKERQEELEDLGLVGVRWGWVYVARRRYALRDRLLNAFARGTARDRSGFPRAWSL
jgi:hypothetical protein